MKKYFLFGFFLLFSMSSYSAEPGEWTKIEQVYTNQYAKIFVTFGADALPGCYQNRSAFIGSSNVDDLGIDIDAMYSTILAAYMGGKEVRPLYIFDNISGATTGWDACYISGLYVRD